MERIKYQTLCVAFAALGVFSANASAQGKASDSTARTIEAIVAHAVFSKPFTCSEHPAGDLAYLGDDLGQDCLIESFVESEGRSFFRTFKTNGLTNADWFGWDQAVLSPCDCVVVRIRINDTTNLPGVLGKPPASTIELRMKDETFLTVAHIQNPIVKVGDNVKAGQEIARVGNNGLSRVPHIHIGAWRGKDALQIRWDLKTVPSP